LEVGRRAEDFALQENYCCKIQRSENRKVQFKTSLAESSEEGYVLKGALFPMMMMIDFENLL
jgi:hypothetical protein